MYAMYKHFAVSNMLLRSEWETWNEHNYLQIPIFRFSDLWSVYLSFCCLFDQFTLID